MLQDYLQSLYRPAASVFQRRTEQQAKLARELHAWHTALAARWSEVHLGAPQARRMRDEWHFDVPVYLGEIAPEWVKVELYADPERGGGAVRQPMERGDAISGAINGYLYWTTVPASRPDWHYTPRVSPYHPETRIPSESGMIAWQR